MKVMAPSKATLKKYGLSEDEWQKILDSQDGMCFVCQKEPKRGRLCIDHFHVRNWKKMPPEQRKLYVRGLLCWWCNSNFLSRGITIPIAKRAVLYLEQYESRKP